MKRRDAAAAGCVLAVLVGITGAFGIWWALIFGGSLGFALIAALVLIELRAKADGA